MPHVPSRAGRPRAHPVAGQADLAFTALACAVSLLGLYLYRGYAGDDTFIHLTYARNLIEGNGFSFNPGEPSYGSTSPLWTVLVAGMGRLLGDVYLGAKVLSGLATFLSVLAFSSLARVTVGPGLSSGLATLAFALDPWLFKWGASGMETSLALLVVLLALRMHLRRREQGGLPGSAFVLGFGTLLRPELIGLFLVALFDRVVVARRSVGEALVAIFLYLVPILPWLLYALATFGDVIPTTVHAKAGYMARAEVFTRTAQILGSAYLAPILALLVGLPLAFRSARGRLLASLRTHTVVWGWVLGLPIAYLITRSYVASRYLLLMTPCLVLLAFVVIQIAWSGPRVRRFVAFVVVLASAASSWIVQAQVVYPRTRFAHGVDERLIDVAKWVRKNTPENALVAVHEVGAIGYFADRRVLDTAGLVTPEALPYVATYRIPELIQDFRPGYYVSSGDARIDRQVFDRYADELTLLYEQPVQRGGSSARFAEPLRVGVYAFERTPRTPAGTP